MITLPAGPKDAVEFFEGGGNILHVANAESDGDDVGGLVWKREGLGVAVDESCCIRERSELGRGLPKVIYSYGRNISSESLPHCDGEHLKSEIDPENLTISPASVCLRP